MEIVKTASFVEFQWCGHIEATPSEIRGRRMLLLDPQQSFVMALGSTIAVMCMRCMVEFAEGKRKLPEAIGN